MVGQTQVQVEVQPGAPVMRDERGILQWDSPEYFWRAQQAAFQIASTVWLVSEHTYARVTGAVPACIHVREVNTLDTKVITFCFNRDGQAVLVEVVLHQKYLATSPHPGKIESVILHQGQLLRYAFTRGEFKQLGILDD